MPRVRATDAAVAVWAALCIALGLGTADRLGELRSATDGLAAVGRDVVDVGGALGALDLPVVGGPVERAAEDVRRSGEQLVASAAQTRGDVGRAAAVVGLAVAVLPLVPVLALYLPWRAAGVRDRRALARLLAAGPDRDLDRLLAHRALMTASWQDLEALGGRPWHELAEGRHERLARTGRARAGLPPEGR